MNPERGVRNCANCMFFANERVSMNGTEYGHCRRRSPVKSESYVGPIHPEVKGSHWCGEWEAGVAALDRIQQQKELIDAGRLTDDEIKEMGS